MTFLLIIIMIVFVDFMRRRKMLFIECELSEHFALYVFNLKSIVRQKQLKTQQEHNIIQQSRHNSHQLPSTSIFIIVCPCLPSAVLRQSDLSCMSDPVERTYLC